MEKPLVNEEFLLRKYPGKSGWTYVTIPQVLQDKQAPFGWVKVKGTIDGYSIKQYHLMPTRSGELFLPIKAEIRKKINKKAGDVVRILLYADNDPIEIPHELSVCLQDDPTAHSIFLGCTGKEQKAFIDWIYSARTDKTRVERIATTLDKLSKGQKSIGK